MKHNGKIRQFVQALGFCAVSLSSAFGAEHPPSPQVLGVVMTTVSRIENRLISGGERGIILYSDDSGKNWHQAKTPSFMTVTKVQFVSPNVGWAVAHGGAVWKTVDGGASWRQVLDGVTAARLEQESALQANESSAGPAEGRRLKDAERLVAEGADKPFLALYFFDEMRGIVLGAYGLAFETRDGGEHWSSMMGKMDNPTGRHFYGIILVEGAIIVVGEQGSAFKSVDNGTSFSALNTGSRGTFFGVVSNDTKSIFAFGLRGTLYRSSDIGAHWERIQMPQASISGAMLEKDGSVILLDEIGHLYRIHEGGAKVALLPIVQGLPSQAIAEAPDGSVVVSTVRGNVNVNINNNVMDGKK